MPRPRPRPKGSEDEGLAVGLLVVDAAAGADIVDDEVDGVEESEDERGKLVDAEELSAGGEDGADGLITGVVGCRRATAKNGR